MSVAGGGQRTLSSLAPGDRIMALSGSGQVVFSQVLLFLHRDQDSRSSFLVLETEDGQRLALTPHHLVFLAPHSKRHYSEYQAQFASRAKRGDYVLISGPEGRVQPSQIISVSVEEGVGVYAPLTEDGTLFVDGVLASSYALVEDHRLAHLAFGPLRFLSSLSQLIWEESSEERQATEGKGVGTKTPSQCRTWIHDKLGMYVSNDKTNSQGNLSVPLTTDIEEKHSSQREVSGLHWYARLLYSLGRFFLDSKSFHP